MISKLRQLVFSELRIALTFQLGCLLLLLTACSGAGDGASNNASDSAGGANSAAKVKSPGADVVRASVSEVRIEAGGKGEAVVLLRIAEGFHVNANPPSDKFLIPTEVEASPSGGLRTAKPVYPPGVTKKFGFSDKPLNVYEGEVAIKLPVSAEAGTPKGRRTLDATVTVQPCDDTECFPKRTINAAIPVVIN